jgi:hypothetical protein
MLVKSDIGHYTLAVRGKTYKGCKSGSDEPGIISWSPNLLPANFQDNEVFPEELIAKPATGRFRYLISTIRFQRLSRLLEEQNE